MVASMARKRIVVCADGTWNSPYRSDGSSPSLTNVLKMSQAVRPLARDGRPQPVFYHTGVGTGWGWIDRLLGGGMGLGISKNILDAYLFLVSNYEAGDEIFLFGFSRGAYTVRSLAGLVRNCGILRKQHADLVQTAYEHYRGTQGEWRPGGDAATQFRERFTWREVPRGDGDPRGTDTGITFVGVWDTVGALGVPGGFLRNATQRWYSFHDTQLSRWVDHAYHALALDECRAAFYPTIWDPKSERLPGQSLEQVWFAGVHSNVGGGYPDPGLSDVAFDWLASSAEQHGLDLDRTGPRLGPNPSGTLVDSQTVGFRVLGVLGKLRDAFGSSDQPQRGNVEATKNAEIARQTNWRGSCTRAVPPGTFVHPSVEARRAALADYRPSNVPPPRPRYVASRPTGEDETLGA